MNELEFQQTLLRRHQERYRRLSIKKAGYGHDCPVHIEMEIDELSETISKIELELKGRSNSNSVREDRNLHASASRHFNNQDYLELKHMHKSVDMLRELKLSMYSEMRKFRNIIDREMITSDEDKILVQQSKKRMWDIEIELLRLDGIIEDLDLNIAKHEEVMNHD